MALFPIFHKNVTIPLSRHCEPKPSDSADEGVAISSQRIEERINKNENRKRTHFE